jgi:hypothetical protein
MLSFIFDTMIAAIVPDRDTTERQDHNGVPVKFKRCGDERDKG